MQIPGINLLKKELEKRDKNELAELCLRLAKYKQENKELLGYLIYDADDHESYIRMIKLDMDDEFELINTSSYYYVKKSVRKILRTIRKYIRFTKSSQVEVELVMYWCQKINEVIPTFRENVALGNLYDRQVVAIQKAIKKLDEDLQFDYTVELERVLAITS